MRPSAFDTYITVVQQTTTKDALGEVNDTWTTVVECFAKRTSRPGREFFQSSRTVDQTQVYFTVRHANDITTAMRVQHGSEVFEIQDIRPSDDRRGPVMLACKQVS